MHVRLDLVSNNMDCVFCSLIEKKDYYLESDLCVALFDGFPVSEGHTLIIPKRHVETYFDLSKEEMEDMYSLSLRVKEFLDSKYHPDGYNVGFNCGEAAGQTVMHAHMHIIPRYKGDSDNPRGGIRKAVKRKGF